MSDSLSRAVIDALLPKGSAWNVKPDSDLDLMFDAMGEFDTDILEFINGIANIRNPFLTPYLSDLEKEYGIKTDNRLTETTRRMQLATRVYKGTNNGSADDLQNAITAAGFDVQIHANSPAVDPDTFLNSVPQMYAGGPNAYAGYYPTTPGEYTSVAGRTGGDLLVNGASFEQAPDYLSVAGAPLYAGDSDSVAGRYINLKQTEIIYEIPDDPDSWPFFFFVGGDATRNVDGELTAIATADIPTSQQELFERIILQYKPMHTWAGLLINYN